MFLDRQFVIPCGSLQGGLSVVLPSPIPIIFFQMRNLWFQKLSHERMIFLKPGLDFGWALLSGLGLPAILDFLTIFPWGNYKILSISVSYSIYKIVILSLELI